jgi:hypothetical protein
MSTPHNHTHSPTLLKPAKPVGIIGDRVAQIKDSGYELQVNLFSKERYRV